MSLPSVAESAGQPPTTAELTHLRPTNARGTLHLAVGVSLSGAAVILALRAEWPLWVLGQPLLALACLFWWASLHEAGHRTLFRTRRLNVLAGQLSGFLAMIPYTSWTRVHAGHHRWTGWQDLDPTTAALAPRPRSALVRFVVRWCWRLWLPLIAVLYRLTNYWHLPRLWHDFPRPLERAVMVGEAILYAAGYGLLLWFGGVYLIVALGPGVFLAFALQDLLILSQHTHIPMLLAEGRAVAPFTPAEQAQFTRSLVVPGWAAHWVLLNFDAHELHHMYPHVPGYHLHRIAYRPGNGVTWWRWALKARGVPGDVLLFQNRNTSGLAI